MAVRRCFSQNIVGSDAFAALDDGVQALYLHLCMAADDDGFLNCAGFIAGSRRCGRAGLETLVRTGFLLHVEGLYVITHWRVANTLKNDRMRLPGFPAAAQKLYVGEDRTYQLQPNGPSLWEQRWNALESKGRLPESKMESQPNQTELNQTQPNPTQPKARRGAYNALVAAYPAHRREDAFGVYCRAVAVGEEREVMESLKRWKASDQWRKERFVPRLSNWLERGIWRTVPEPSGRSPSGSLGGPELEAIARVLEG